MIIMGAVLLYSAQSKYIVYHTTYTRSGSVLNLSVIDISMGADVRPFSESLAHALFLPIFLDALFCFLHWQHIGALNQYLPTLAES